MTPEEAQLIDSIAREAVRLLHNDVKHFLPSCFRWCKKKGSNFNIKKHCDPITFDFS